MGEVILLNKDKHVLPEDTDTFTDRVRREAGKKRIYKRRKTIFGPDNEPLARVDVEMGKELTRNK